MTVLAAHLRIALKTATATAQRIGAAPLPRVPALAGQADRMEQRFLERDHRPDDATLSALLDRVLAAGGLAPLDRTDRRRLAWSLWLEDRRGLAQDQQLLIHYMKWLALNGTGRYPWRALIDAWLDRFDYDRPHIGPVAAAIRGRLERWHWVWYRRQQRFGLFDPDTGPAALARHVLVDAPDAATALADFGLIGRLARGGFAEAGFRLALAALGQVMTDDSARGEVLNRVLRWAVGEKGLNYPRSIPVLVDTLLQPWVSHDVPPDLRRGLTAFLAIQIGDPRREDSRWDGVGLSALGVMQRWLVQEALDRFAPVVEALAHDNRWGYRRAFWQAYLTKGAISDAWLVMAEAAERNSPGIGRNGVGFGRLATGGGAEANHAVLILRIGGLTIADWSHNGKCYVWVGGNMAAPVPHRADYQASDLMTGADNRGTVHARGDFGGWQRELASFIRDRTGIEVSEKSYMPIGWR